MTIDTKELRELLRSINRSPLPWMLATSNSWRRIVDARDCCVCEPTTQPDGHPDLIFHGGYDGPNARLLIEAVNALPELLQIVDAQAAEIERLQKSLMWTAASLSTVVNEDDEFRMDTVKRTAGEILDEANSLLAQE